MLEELLETLNHKLRYESDLGFREGLMFAIDLVRKAALNQTSESTATSWRSVKDALPDGNRSVLVEYNEIYSDGVHKQYAVAFFGKYTRQWIEPCSGINLDVTKWREIDIPKEVTK